MNAALSFFDDLFGQGTHDCVVDGHFVSGHAKVGGQDAVVVGSWDQAALDGELTLNIAQVVLDTIRADSQLAAGSQRPIIFIADTQGQALSRHEELLGLNGSFAHLARCVDLARRHGHATLAIIHGEAVSGGFLAFGLMADQVFAVPDVQVRVMDLRAMSRVTKIPLEKLESLATSSPVFAPGAHNYWRMGAIEAMWPASAEVSWPALLAEALARPASTADDLRAETGLSRGGRTLAASVIRQCLSH